MAGNDSLMLENISIAKRTLDRDLPILILGATGSGKGALAKSIHFASNRSDKPFIVINCAAIPENLIESELFGYRPGAFTGADNRGYKGKILEANGGTLFLDEIGDMPIHLQTRLLRVLSENEVMPLGSKTPLRVEFSVISATLHDLEKLIVENRFREDLYYRLNGVSLKLPSVREREDKDYLIDNILTNELKRNSLQKSISEGVLRIFNSYFWPGNIREMQNVIRYAVTMSSSDTIETVHLPPYFLSSTDKKTKFENKTESEAEKNTTVLALKHVNWNVSAAAKLLGISRSTLHRRIKLQNIKRS